MADKQPDISTQQAGYWLSQIEGAEKEDRYKRWVSAGQQFMDRYRLEASGMYMSSGGQVGIAPKRMTYNLLWSNVQTMLPMLYSRMPEVYVSRRFHMEDPVARMAATIGERSVTVDLDRDDFEDQARGVALDYSIVGRGNLRAAYESSTLNSRIPVSKEDREDGEPRFVTEAGDPIPKEMVERDERGIFVTDPRTIDERAPLTYQNWQDLLIGPGRKWSEVQKTGWIAWRNYMTKADARRRFGDAAEKLSYTSTPYKNEMTGQGGSKSIDQKTTIKMAVVYEVWDARSRRIYWVSKGYDRLLDVEDDFLELDGFFNTPRPLTGTFTNDTMIPVPDYAEVLTQATELDQITAKIEQIVEDIRAGGVYDGAIPSLGNALRNKKGTWTGIDEWGNFAAGGGMQGKVQNFVSAEQIRIVQELYRHRDAVKRDADEMWGLIDLFRGQQTQQDETLGQSEIRKSMGGLRINQKQRDFQRYLRDALRLKSEIVVTKFDTERILAMADLPSLMRESPEITTIQQNMQNPQIPQGVRDPAQVQQILAQQRMVLARQMQVAQQKQFGLIMSAAQLLKNDRMRGFKLDIETDATVALDEAMEKAQANEFITAVGDFLNNVLSSEVVASNRDLRMLAAEMLMFLVRRHHIGRSMEQKVLETVTKLATAPEPEQQPDALMESVKVQDKQVTLRAQNEAEKNKIDAFEAVTDRQKAQAQALEAAKDAERKDVETAAKLLDGIQSDMDRVEGNA